MSEDEALVGIICLVIATISWSIWIFGTVGVRIMGQEPGTRMPVYAAPALGCLGLFAVLRLLASWDVRDSAMYQGFYLAFGAAW